MWTKTPDTVKVSYQNASSVAAALRTGGYSDWRVPSIKELYSLMDFSGYTGTNSSNAKPYINTSYFDFYYGSTSVERYIDAQFVTTAKYVSLINNKDKCMFGVNFADGRIKCYPISSKTFYAYYVRGDSNYGKNDFEDNGDETITDRASGLTWMKYDSGEAMNWNDGLKFCENLDLANHKFQILKNFRVYQIILDHLIQLLLLLLIQFLILQKQLMRVIIEIGHFSGHLQLIMKQMQRKPAIWHLVKLQDG